MDTLYQWIVAVVVALTKPPEPEYRPQNLVMMLVVHLLLGFVCFR